MKFKSILKVNVCFDEIFVKDIYLCFWIFHFFPFLVECCDGPKESRFKNEIAEELKIDANGMVFFSNSEKYVFPS